MHMVRPGPSAPRPRPAPGCRGWHVYWCLPVPHTGNNLRYDRTAKRGLSYRIKFRTLAVRSYRLVLQGYEPYQHGTLRTHIVRTYLISTNVPVRYERTVIVRSVPHISSPHRGCWVRFVLYRYDSTYGMTVSLRYERTVQVRSVPPMIPKFCTKFVPTVRSVPNVRYDRTVFYRTGRTRSYRAYSTLRNFRTDRTAKRGLSYRIKFRTANVNFVPHGTVTVPSRYCDRTAAVRCVPQFDLGKKANVAVNL